MFVVEMLRIYSFEHILCCFSEGLFISILLFSFYLHYFCVLYPLFNGTHKSRYYQACSQVGAAGSDPVLDRIARFQDACWRFLRPHTIRGTALGSTYVFFLHIDL